MEADSTAGYCDVSLDSLNGASNKDCGVSTASEENIGFRYTIDFPVNSK
jgi:hypothetical protein